MRWTIAAFALFLAAPALAEDPPGCENASSNVEIGICVSRPPTRRPTRS